VIIKKNLNSGLKKMRVQLIKVSKNFFMKAAATQISENLLLSNISKRAEE
jgi:hypothetical protein